MIDLLMLVIRCLGGLRRGGETVAGRNGFFPPVRAVGGMRREIDRVIATLLDVRWMTVRLDSLSCVRVLSGSSSARRGPMPRWVPPHRGGV